MINLVPDITLLIQMGIFLVALLGMHFLIFRPVLKIIGRRRELTDEARNAADNLTTQSEEMLSNYEAKMQEARQSGIKIKEQLKKDGEVKAQQTLATVRQEIDEKVEKNRKEIQEQSQKAGQALEKIAGELSQEMAEKLVGRKVA